MSDSNVKQKEFQHVVLGGAAYEVGRQQGEMLAAVGPVGPDFLRMPPEQSDDEAWRMAAEFERLYPSLAEEARGFADGLKLPYERVVFLADSYLFAQSGHCSHFAVLPRATREGHTLVGRSYEFGDVMDDFRLCTTRINGRYAHIGCSSLFFGRQEGLNEHGLTVTTSAGGIPVGRMEWARRPIQDGFQFWILARAILEECRTVDEALALVDRLPMCGNPNLIVADRSGQAALIEIYGPHKAVRRIGPQSAESFLCSTNHYTLPEMQPYRDAPMNNSVVRYDKIQAFLNRPALDVAQLKTLQAQHYPDGPCCHYYEEFFGTLRSFVFDLTAGEVWVSFGSPAASPWVRFDLSGQTGFAQYTAILPQQRTEPSFWTPRG